MYGKLQFADVGEQRPGAEPPVASHLPNLNPPHRRQAKACRTLFRQFKHNRERLRSNLQTWGSSRDQD